MRRPASIGVIPTLRRAQPQERLQPLLRQPLLVSASALLSGSFFRVKPLITDFVCLDFLECHGQRFTCSACDLWGNFFATPTFT